MDDGPLSTIHRVLPRRDADEKQPAAPYRQPQDTFPASTSLTLPRETFARPPSAVFLPLDPSLVVFCFSFFFMK